MDSDEPLFTSCDTEELDYGPTWLILAILLILTGFALIGLAIFLMLA